VKDAHVDGVVETTVDVSEAADLDEQCFVAITAFLPQPDCLADPAIVCFGFPGGGYNRGYFSLDLPGTIGGQAAWHMARGWIFVAVDNLGVGESTVLDTGDASKTRLTLEVLARSDAATVEAVMDGLANGTFVPGYPPIAAVRLGIGHSLGGGYLIVAQAHREIFDGVGILGFSAIHNVGPTRPGTPSLPLPWIPRGSSMTAPIVLNRAALAQSAVEFGTEFAAERGDSRGAYARAARIRGEHPYAWLFHFDDEDPDVVATDMAVDPEASMPAWKSATVAQCAIYMSAPGVVAAEAAAIRVPVLIAAGERDVVPDPRIEPRAYISSKDITVVVCPQMAHLHNFARTRERLWARIHHWGNGVAESVLGR
jgi:pimeloyl-ACP methyl ester carboxylesterase